MLHKEILEIVAFIISSQGNKLSKKAKEILSKHKKNLARAKKIGTRLRIGKEIIGFLISCKDLFK
jgi:hypothetical protein